MTHKHNFIFKAASVLCMALVIVLLSSFVYPVANEVSAKEATSTTVIIPPPYLASAPAVTEGTEIQPEEESVDVSAPVVPYTEEDLDLLARLKKWEQAGCRMKYSSMWAALCSTECSTRSSPILYTM